MDVRERSTYTPSLESSNVAASSQLHADRRAPASINPASGQDSSALSSAAQVAAQAIQLPEVRQDRVSALQQQIASGSYHVAPQDVADAMVRDLRG